MQAKPFDWSQLGVKTPSIKPQTKQPVQAFDWSQLGLDSSPQQVKAPQERQQPQAQQKESTLDYIANSWPVNATLGAGDSLRKLLSLGYAEPNPTHTTGKAYEAGHLAGDIAGFIGAGSLLKAAPLIRKIPETIEAIKYGGPLASRMLGSTLFGAAENPESRTEGALEGAKSGVIGEAMAAPFRGLTGIAEFVNPVKAAEKVQKGINKAAIASKTAMEDAYNPVSAEYGNHLVTVTPRKYLDFGKNVTKYFTPEVKKVLEDFRSNPTYDNLHKLQSQMGTDAAKLANTPAKINTYQALKNAHDFTMNKLENFLKHDPGALAQYQLGKTIGREEYYPFLASKNLQKISKGIKSDYTPQELIKEISQVIESRALNKNPIGKEHHLIKSLEHLTKKVNRGDLIKNLITVIATTGGAFSGIPGGAAAGLGSHFLTPHILAALQNKKIQQFSGNTLNPLLRGFLEQGRPRMPNQE